MEQLSWLDEPICKKSKKIKKSKNVVLSASRMTDMPKFYPDELIYEVQKRIDKGVSIHTLVIWTKHPGSLLKEKLYNYLVKLKKMGIQLYLQCTITGMGSVSVGRNKDGSKFILEPAVPNYNKSINDLEKVIELLESPLRVKLRIDPIIRIKNKYTNKTFNNLIYFEDIMYKTSKLGIKDYTFSFVEEGIHKKVDYRFNKYEWKLLSPSKEEKENVYVWVKKKADKYNVNISACCVSGLDESKCIDGNILKQLHDNRKDLNLNEPRKRVLCGCTESIDLGGWPPKKCYSGCKYCYANAKID